MKVLDENILFVGGIADGRRVWIPNDRDHVTMPKFTDNGWETEVYHRQHLRGERQTIGVMVLQGISGDGLLGLLIDRYPQAQETRSQFSPCRGL